MELIAQYSEILGERKSPLLIDAPDHWKSFHESDDKRIAVYAGRRSGKSYNLLLKALSSPLSSIILVSSEVMVKAYIEAFRQMHQTYDDLLDIERINSRRDFTTIIFTNGKRVSVNYISQASQLRGQKYQNMNVMIDEPEYMPFSAMMDWISEGIYDSTNIVCVGSMRYDHSTPYMRWFHESDGQLIIPTPRELAPDAWNANTMYELNPNYSDVLRSTRSLGEELYV